jgi:hypothetical protein
LDKFEDNDGNWESIQRVEGGIPNIAVLYSLQQEELQWGQVTEEREQEWVEV